MTLEQLKIAGEAPEWMNDESLKILQGGYMLPGETPRKMYWRVAEAAASYYKDKLIWSTKFYNAMWRNWLCPASPVLSNMGTDRGLPISCLTGNTWISTPTGATTIADINIGDLVLTHEGRFRSVTDKKSRMSSGDLFEIKIGTRLTKTKITGNHPVMTNLGWVRVDQLDIGRHLIATSDEIEYPEIDHVLDMGTYISYPTIEKDGLLYKKIENNGPDHKKKKNNIVENYSAPKAKVDVDDDVAWFIGLWLAEGSRTTNNKKNPNGIRITMGVGEELAVERFIKIAKEKFNLNGSYCQSEVSRPNFAKGRVTRWISANINGGSIGRLFCEEFGINCKTKTLPIWVLNLPKRRLTQLLDGLIEGDGYRLSNGTWSITLANPRLLMGVYNICLKLGIQVSLQMQSKPSTLGTTKYVYVLRSLKVDSIKLSKFNKDAGIKFGKLRYCPILQLQKLHVDEEVFDISVEEDHSFAASGFIVHNCNSIHVGDSVDSIFMKNHELAMLSKNGAGVGIYMGDVRGRNAIIKGNGKSEGIIPWCKNFDSTVVSVSQGNTRRGAAAAYTSIRHSDIEEFLQMRRPTGDVNRRCLNLNHGICIDDEWMKDMLAGDKAKRQLWQEVLKARVETGEPYLFFSDNVNRQNPECYVQNGLDVKTSNICTEIFLYTDSDHSFVCCLSSLNLVKWEEWKDTDTVEVVVRFLDAVIEEYIEKSAGIPGMQASRQSAMKGRAIGIGVLGWHTFLQKKMIPFDSFPAMSYNNLIFKTIREKAESATKELALELGEPQWCNGYNRRNTHLMAVAPTVSNSTISGGHSAGIEPVAANIFSQKSAKGTFIKKNLVLETLLESKGKNTTEIWKSINEQGGSVQHLNCLSHEEKAVFLTAREINQHAIIKQAAQRQKYIDQGQSVNLFFAANSDAKYIHQVHLAAWELGLKSLYYLRTEGVIRGDLASRSKDECAACEA